VGAAVEEHITCSCGNSFYFIGSRGISVVIPEEETGNAAFLLKGIIAKTGRECVSAAGPYDYTAVLREADPERLLGVSLTRLQEETFGVNILKANNVVALCEYLNRGVDVAVRYKQDKDRIVLNRLDSKDLMAEWSRKHEGELSRAGDSHYQPGEWADWQITTSEDMAYFRQLGAQHEKSG